MTKRKLAPPLLRGLGITLDVEDGEHLVEVLVIAKAWNPETGNSTIVFGSSKGADWIAQQGLLAAGRLVVDDYNRRHHLQRPNDP